MDRHTLNTILTMRAERNDLSKMMSVIEAALYPLSPARFPVRQIADQNSFFSQSHRPATADKQTTSYFFGPSYRRKEQKSNSVKTAKPSENQLLDSSDNQAVAPAIHYRPSLCLSAVNTHTFELLIETAIKVGATFIAIHYLRELLSAWQQERLRLIEAHASLLDWKGHSSSGKSATAAPPLSLHELNQITGSNVGFSYHLIWIIYESMKSGPNESQRKYPYLRGLVAEGERIMALLQEDVALWSHVLNKKRDLQRMQESCGLLGGDAAEAAEGTRIVSEDDGFSSKTQLRLAKRNEVELDALLGRMRVKAADLASQRRARVLIAALRRTNPFQLQYLPSSIRRAQRWIALDESADAHRIQAIKQMRTFSEIQKQQRVLAARKRFSNRRQSVKRAIDVAAEALAASEQRQTEVEEFDLMLAADKDRETRSGDGQQMLAAPFTTQSLAWC